MVRVLEVAHEVVDAAGRTGPSVSGALRRREQGVRQDVRRTPRSRSAASVVSRVVRAVNRVATVRVQILDLRANLSKPLLHRNSMEDGDDR